MKIKEVSIRNFRGYTDETTVSFNDLTVFVGRNDVGKSSVLEALDLFFNEGKGVIKYDKGDINIISEDSEFIVSISFTDLPEKVVVDATYETSLKDEYLLYDDTTLKIIKKFNGSKCTGTFIRALHPINIECADLHSKKRNDLKDIIEMHGIDCDGKNVNSKMRKAIWQHYQDKLQLETVDIDVTVGDDTKKIWEKLAAYLPLYSLFQSDRQNSDGDKEIQDPLKVAVSQFLQDQELQQILNDVASKVESRLREVSERTLEKLKEMDPSIADSLKPVIPSASNLKWADVFKSVSITSDEGIPINKRGSGVKRLILLNFFRAEAERRQQENNNSGVIYAFEEPETSQHFANQKILAKALKNLAHTPNTQIILTTHSGIFVKDLEHSDLRLVIEDEHNKTIKTVEKGPLPYPSINEVNYIAFGEITEEYHNELYGFIEYKGWMTDYENGKPQRQYKRERNGRLDSETISITRYIRHKIHHPENRHNKRYTDAELAQSIEEMRKYISSKMQTAP